MADLLVEEGLPGLFVVQARRAELWAEARRADLVAALRRHEVGLHGRDVHPVPPELVERLDWAGGVAALLESERGELETLGRVLDAPPVCLSEHRGFGAPQLFAVARQLGRPYLFGFPAAPPAHSVSRYAGALNVPFDSPVDGFLGFFPAVFDDVLHDDRPFQSLLARLRAHVAAADQAGLPLLVVFTCHPERLCYAGPLERWQYGNGLNRDPAAVPPGVEQRRGRAEVERALANLRTLLRYLRDSPELTPITVAELVRRYGAQPNRLERAELAAAAAQALESGQIVGGARASAAETLLAWCDALASPDAEPPARSPRRDVLGPTEPPPLAPELATLEPVALATLAGRLLFGAAQTGHLPAALELDGRAIGLGSLYGALAAAYLAADRGQPPATVRLEAWPRYPALAGPLGQRFRRCAEDPLIRPDLSTDALARHAALQSWTLKPAPRQ
ncbi:MAG TPA: hypothetical protein VGL23_08105 [Chloroflexota bacterium]